MERGGEDAAQERSSRLSNECNVVLGNAPHLRQQDKQ